MSSAPVRQAKFPWCFNAPRRSEPPVLPPTPGAEDPGRANGEAEQACVNHTICPAHPEAAHETPQHQPTMTRTQLHQSGEKSMISQGELGSQPGENPHCPSPQKDDDDGTDDRHLNAHQPTTR